ncbi:hypothetical protein OROGR_010817 [Orobanche gracilis]
MMASGGVSRVSSSSKSGNDGDVAGGGPTAGRNKETWTTRWIRESCGRSNL